MDFDNLPFVKAKYITPGRNGNTIRLIVIHTAENTCRAGMARNIAGYFVGAPTPASAGYVVDPANVINCVHDEDTADHAPPVNVCSIGIEHTAYAATTDWTGADAKAMLDLSAQLVAYLCTKYNIPIQRVDDLSSLDATGIVGHDEVTACFHKSTHTDPGKAFPWDDYIASCAAYQTVTP